MRVWAGSLIDDGPDRPAPMTTLLACGVCGIVGADALPGTAWMVTATFLVLVTTAFRGRRGRRLALVGATIALAATVANVRTGRTPRDDLRAFLDDASQLVTVEGAAFETPTLKAAAGSMRQFDHRGPATVFPLAVEALRAEATTVRVRGVIWVRVGGVMPPLRPGQLVTATGTLRAFPPPPNPGWPRVRPRLRHDAAATLFVADRDQLAITPGVADRAHRWRRVRAALRARVAAVVTRSAGPRPPRAHLLEALLLGRRTRDAAATDDRFRRIGLAHLLAISGMHLGIVVAMVLGLSRLAGGGPRLEGLVILLAVGGYLFLVETRLPVVRAGVMAACFGLGRLLGRRGRLDGIVAFGGVALLAARPDDLFRAGFQLSFAVVFGLVYLTPTVRRRWFGPPRRDLAGPVAMLRERSRDAIAAAVVAWVVATPIIMYHFGILSPLTVPLSLIALPFVTAVLGLGYAAMLLDPLLPSVAATLEPVLRGVTDMLLTIAQIADATPGASVNVIPPPAVWTIGMGVWTWVWGRTPNASSRRRRRVVTVTGAMLVAGYATVGVPHPWRPALRLDMLAVSDGSSILLGCGRERLLFDAGSMSHPDAGRTRIVPALRRLGVRRLNAIAVSHPDLDHYSAVLEVVDAFPVDAVLLTPAFRRHARRDTSGPEAFLLAALRRRGCPTETIVAGDARRLGGATLRWRHPDRDDVFDADNDGSMVVDIDVAGRRVLLTGDLDRDGIATLLSRHPFLRADVVELPHHGSAGPAVTRLIEHVDPRYLLQSTGPRRLRKDAIADAVAGRTRLVTARDGASTVIIDSRGRIRVRTHLGRPRGP